MKQTVLALLCLCMAATAHAQKKTPVRTGAETPLGDTRYSISLPGDYTLETMQGPDFDVYYLRPKDSLVEASYTGGIYFGNHPSDDKPSGNCRTEKIKSSFLNAARDFTLTTCEEYDVQTVVNTGDENYIHAFGHGKSRADVDKLLKIYATLRRH